jgi:hypothetical protein
MEAFIQLNFFVGGFFYDFPYFDLIGWPWQLYNEEPINSVDLPPLALFKKKAVVLEEPQEGLDLDGLAVGHDVLLIVKAILREFDVRIAFLLSEVAGN